jgi:hypothetical protein
LERLEVIDDHHEPQHWKYDMENTQWLELFRPFTSVKDLGLTWHLVHLVAPALKELTGERATEVLPMLQNLSFPGSWPSKAAEEAIEKFIAARQLSGRPITVLHGDRRNQK